MTTTDLVPVFTGTIQNQSVQLCNARDLYKFLGSGREFATWIKTRIEQYSFIDGEDFLTILSKTSKGTKGGRPTTDYHLTLDMAKELAMVENNEKGRQIRRYFISLERTNKPALPSPANQAEQLAKQIEQRLLKSLGIAYKQINPPTWTRPGKNRDLYDAKQIIIELEAWAQTLPEEIGKPLCDALHELIRLMDEGWDEINEGLRCIFHGAYRINRWRGTAE